MFIVAIYTSVCSMHLVGVRMMPCSSGRKQTVYLYACPTDIHKYSCIIHKLHSSKILTMQAGGGEERVLRTHVR